MAKAMLDAITLVVAELLRGCPPMFDPRDFHPQRFAQADRRVVNADPVDRRP